MTINNYNEVHLILNLVSMIQLDRHRPSKNENQRIFRREPSVIELLRHL